MKCPRCVQRIHRAAESCPQCGFTLADADLRLGAAEVRIRSLTDAAGVMRREDRHRVEHEMERIGRVFPQVFVAVYTGSLGELTNIRQFGFWLLNRSAFEDVPLEKPNEGGILLTIDPQSKAAGIVFGYLLDPFLDESDTFECLSRAHPYWLEGRYADGILKVLEHLDGILRKRCGQARRNPEFFERKIGMAGQARDLLRRLRSDRVALPGQVAGSAGLKPAVPASLAAPVNEEVGR